MGAQRTSGRTILAACAALAALSPQGAAAETISAFATWVGHGEAVRSAPAEATFVGALSGFVYVNTEEGPVWAGRILCPAIIRIDTASGRQSGDGGCTVTAPDGAQLFAVLACSGVHLIGCSGQMKLTGGSGRFQGISGGGKVTLRSDLNGVDRATTDRMAEDVHGIIFWPDLQYTLP